MRDLSSGIQLLRSSPASFVVTTGFNFVSISLLLWMAYSHIPSTTVATVAAHIAGMLVSMLFCLDFWWTHVSRQMELPVTLSERGRFLGIATTSAFIAACVVSFGATEVGTSSHVLIALNWLALGLVALVKYIVMIAFVPSVRKFFRVPDKDRL